MSERDFESCIKEAYKRGYLDGRLGELWGAWDMGYQAAVKDAEHRVGEALKTLLPKTTDAPPPLS